MKKALTVLLIVLTLVLSACASQAAVAQNSEPAQASDDQAANLSQPTTQPTATSPAESTPTAESVLLNTDYENAVSIPMQLILGTLELKETAQAVTQEQAAVLLPLWTSYQSLVTSQAPGQEQNTTSDVQTQIDELITQIQTAMTADQISAISALQITQETSRTMMEDLGLTMGGPQKGGGGPGSGGGDGMPQQGDAQGTPPAPPDGANPPSGDGQGGQGRGAGGPMGEATGTPPDGGGQMISPDLMEALIQLLNNIG